MEDQKKFQGKTHTKIMRYVMQAFNIRFMMFDSFIYTIRSIYTHEIYKLNETLVPKRGY